jgi:MarR family transcriptional regulator, organic hydroperoxide resistance regulator
MPNDKREIMNLLFATVKIIKENFSKQKVDGISLAQIKTLGFIEKKKNPTMKEVADELGITPPSATVLVDSFVLHGLVKRVYNTDDRRTIKLALTIKGKNYLNEHFKNMAQKMENLLSHLNKNQINNFKEILNILLKNSKK